MVEAINAADLAQYKDFGRVMTVRTTNDDYEVYSVIKDKNSTKSDVANNRSKSANITQKGYSESEVRFKKQNYFGDPTKSPEVQTLGFAKDFLDFQTKSPALLISNKNDDIEGSKRYDNVDLSKLQDLDFTTNRPDNKLLNQIKQRKDGNLNIIDEVNERDYETPQYPVAQRPLKPQPKEESILDL